MDQELFEFPVYLEDRDEIVTLLLTNEEVQRASSDEEYLKVALSNAMSVINDTVDTQQHEEIDTSVVASVSHNIAQDDAPSGGDTKSFIWPDAAVYLFIELYRERASEFTSGMKRHNVLWADIAKQMRETNGQYAVTGQQCSAKMAGLKRTYKSIVDQNKKSGNGLTTWIFYSVMDSLIGGKAFIEPPAIATSDGPAPPQTTTQSNAATSAATRLSSSCSLQGSPNAPKKRRVENILENYIEGLRMDKDLEKTERDKERILREKAREERHRERRGQREQIHNDNMEIQKSLVDVLKILANKK